MNQISSFGANQSRPIGRELPPTDAMRTFFDAQALAIDALKDRYCPEWRSQECEEAL